MSEHPIDLKDFSEADVIAFQDGEKIIRIYKLIQKFEDRFKHQRDALHYYNILINHEEEIKKVKDKYTCNWFGDGENCEVLAVGASEWKKGKFRVNLTFEFIPEIELKENSDLDNFRDNQFQKNSKETKSHSEQTSNPVFPNSEVPQEFTNWPPDPMN